MRGRMTHGPVPRTDGPVIVSLTEFTARRLRDLPGIVRDGVGLSRGWWAMPGAIGVLLYMDPARKRGGSLSVWASEDDLRRFVALPRHAAIMREYRSRVSVRAAMWETDRFRTADAWAQRHDRLAAADRR
jgi:heme-degrading monooxygenase HmoA